MTNYDVFLSHNSKDKAVVEQIARKLIDEFKFKGWFDKRNLIPSRPRQEELESGLNESETVVVFLGETGFGKWENEEMLVAIESRVSDSSQRLIPSYCQVHHRGEAIDPIKYLSAPENQDLGVVKRLRKKQMPALALALSTA